ncbi:GDP-mannose 4,6-dehydratase [Candidatus Poribacteria bacterium]|nr:GDP-mannose 4,6-dehydratase [Candidatus Poribacteria bacterium]
MRALVTGVAGFIGSSLAEALIDRGDTVIGMDCFTDYYARAIKERNLLRLRGHQGFEFLEMNLLDTRWENVLEGVDVVFHQAAQAGVRASWGQEFVCYTNWNILATQQLLEAVRMRRQRPRVVYASSSSIYGEREDMPLRETDTPHPISPYGVTKLAAEHLCILYAANFGLETSALRYFTVYGPRQRPDMAFHKFLRAVFNGQEIPLYGDGEQTRDFTYISDAVAANLAAADRALPGGIYNIGGGSRVTVRRTLDVLAAATGREVRIKQLPRQHGDVTHTLADTSRAAADLGWKPAVSLEEGMAREAQYVRDLMAEGL